MAKKNLGGVEDKSASSNDIEAKLWGFDVNSAEIMQIHKEWLLSFVSPILMEGGSITLVGEASRTGSNQHNLALSKRRASNIAAYLYFISGKHFSVNITHGAQSELGVGEAAAAWAGQKDGTEDAYFRAVRIRAWLKPSPPPPPKPDKKAVKTKHVVTRRKWKWVNLKSVGPSDPGAVIGNSLFKYYQNLEKQTLKGFGEFERRFVESGFNVNRVTYELTEDCSRRELTAKMDTITTVVTYSWGVPSKSVVVEGRVIYKYVNNEQRYKSFGTKSIPRDIIWSKALHPERKVYSELGPNIYDVFVE